MASPRLVARGLENNCLIAGSSESSSSWKMAGRSIPKDEPCLSNPSDCSSAAPQLRVPNVANAGAADSSGGGVVAVTVLLVGAAAAAAAAVIGPLLFITALVRRQRGKAGRQHVQNVCED